MRLNGAGSFHEAKDFLWDMYQWLESGLPSWPDEGLPSERFALLWKEHLEVRDTVARFVFACLNAHEAAEVDLSRKTQRQLYIRVVSAIPLAYDPKSLNTKLVGVVLAGEQRSQTMVHLLLCRLWDADTWPRLCLARYADAAKHAEDLERCQHVRQEWMAARSGEPKPVDAPEPPADTAAVSAGDVEPEPGESVIRVAWRSYQSKLGREE